MTKPKQKPRKKYIKKQPTIKQRLNESLAKNQADKKYFDKVLDEFRKEAKELSHSINYLRSENSDLEAELTKVRTQNRDFIEAISIMGRFSRTQEFDKKINTYTTSITNHNNQQKTIKEDN